MKLNLEHFLAFFTTCGAGKPAASGKGSKDGSAGKPVVEPPAGARAVNGKGADDDADGDDGDEPAEGEEDGDEEDDEEGVDADSDEDEGDEDADGDEDDDDEGEGEDEEDETDVDEDEVSEQLRDSWSARLASSKETDPDFSAAGVKLDWNKTGLSDEQHKALKAKLVDPKADDADRAQQERDADRILDVVVPVARVIAAQALGLYHDGSAKGVAERLTAAERKAEHGSRMKALEAKHGDALTLRVQTRMAKIFGDFVEEHGYAKAITVPWEKIYRMVPRKLREAEAAKAGKRGKGKGGDEESRQERRARRERDEALAAGASPRGGIAKVGSGKGGRNRANPEDREQRAVAHSIRTSGAFWK